MSESRIKRRRRLWIGMVFFFESRMIQDYALESESGIRNQESGINGMNAVGHSRVWMSFRHVRTTLYIIQKSFLELDSRVKCRNAITL
ncbi:hypothetical protein JT359_18225 [Candidatus Poribacteria bacterium]|nr:hypothetical protein [Candidatus Poribacteria bacterium]